MKISRVFYSISILAFNYFLVFYFLVHEHQHFTCHSLN